MVTLDITYGRPELSAVRDAARVPNNWGPLCGTLTDGVVDGEDRSDRVAVAAATIVRGTRGRVPPGLDAWLSTRPGDPSALLLRGAVEVLRAWEVRGARLASQTEGRRLAEFVSVLGHAESLCRAAAQLAPTDPTPWLYLLHMARGQQVGAQETLNRLARLELCSPGHLAGYYQAVYSLSPMWGTPVEVMREQVGKWTAAAAPGSPLHSLLFVANFEWWRRDRLAHADVFQDEQARDEARRAADLMTMEPCQRPADYLAHNYAAGWFSYTGERKRALAHFRLLGGHCTRFPWDYDKNRPRSLFWGKRLRARVPVG
ncbi:hypothetical protein GCM10023322_57400 [Rugosimonospora acidiphila]|uniref:DUF4034 domain-containing protein n=1 Tax=Rugosimonospora acidiphila TaxID=556531 RepID=A0ABP9SDA4_9ACTN